MSICRFAAAGQRKMSTDRIGQKTLTCVLTRSRQTNDFSILGINARATFANAMLRQLDACGINVGNGHIWFSDEAYLPLDALSASRTYSASENT